MRLRRMFVFPFNDIFTSAKLREIGGLAPRVFQSAGAYPLGDLITQRHHGTFSVV